MQEAWLKVSRSDTGGVENLGGWLTTVVGRVCLDMLIDVNYFCRPCCLTSECYPVALAKSWPEVPSVGWTRMSRRASAVRHSCTRRWSVRS